MELRVLRYFLAVVREENILRASEVLHITQPSVVAATRAARGRTWGKAV